MKNFFYTEIKYECYLFFREKFVESIAGASLCKIIRGIFERCDENLFESVMRAFHRFGQSISSGGASPRCIEADSRRNSTENASKAKIVSVVSTF